MNKSIVTAPTFLLYGAFAALDLIFILTTVLETMLLLNGSKGKYYLSCCFK